MAKKAYLVTCEFITRVILDESEVGNDDVLEPLVKENLIRKIGNDEIIENITEVREDVECPYTPMTYWAGDKVRVKTKAFENVYGEDNIWVIDFIKTLNGYPNLYVCYRENDTHKTLFEFLASEVELIK